MRYKKTMIVATIAALMLITIVLMGCGPADPELEPGAVNTQAEIKEKPYSESLEKRLAQELGNDTLQQVRPDYLPKEMFVRLPEFPADFYSVRNLVRLGRITDLKNLEERYWMQPEFFPHFEDIGVPLLQNPPENRWGAYGIATYPADSVATIRQGESLEMHFFIKSNYIVETYQGINLVPAFPPSVDIESGFEMPDGSRSVTQDPEKAAGYFDITASPNPFILEPNFPIYNPGGTLKVAVTITAHADTPPGNYVVGLDTGTVPEEYEQMWLKDYLNLYTSGGMTKIDRPYYQAFIEVVGGDNE
ncbi:MAG: hypothetical protein V1729_03320 [Candidatus Woesearchaeota archaeon]